jgi:transposase
MNKKDKRKFTAGFKVKVAMEAVKGQSTIAEIAKNYDLHPSQIMDWKRILSERSEELFTLKGKKTDTASPDNSALYEQIGRLQIELSFLKKKLRQ